MVKTRINFFKEIISNKKRLSNYTKGFFIYKFLNDKLSKYIQKKIEFFNSKQETFEFFVLLFLYNFHPKIKKIINDSLKENELFFSKYNDESSPDVKIKKYWYEISTISSDIYKYKSIKKFVDKTHEIINKNTKFIHIKKEKGFIDGEEQINYFIKEINNVINKKLNKIYRENKKKFKIKRLIIFQAFPLITPYSILFLEYWITNFGKEIYQKVKNNIKIYICFPKPFSQKNTIPWFILDFNEKKPKKYIEYKLNENIVIEINSKTKIIYENNKKIYETNFFKSKCK